MMNKIDREKARKLLAKCMLSEKDVEDDDDFVEGWTCGYNAGLRAAVRILCQPKPKS